MLLLLLPLQCSCWPNLHRQTVASASLSADCAATSTLRTTSGPGIRLPSSRLLV
ncbi:hypothetical protein CCHR01_16612 [Colletotrichum chrysophilum]|uniref:Uncharacterized protein n=1 Tax=Colletotrichum chrysophilum TaxID=1836956 RepID=A0AAD9A436_9PEZI|nr:hypothetical protein CCHR01_16612 [Colletotrichum chrysophilum]